MIRFGLLLVIMGVVGCHSSSSQIEQESKPQAMAPQMRLMLQELQIFRETLQNQDSFSVSIPDHWWSLPEKVASQKHQQGEAFNQHRQAFLDSAAVIFSEQWLDKVKFNRLTHSCIQCHQSYCPGPIKTIRKQLFSGT